MITFQKNDLLVIVKNPEFKDADDYFATVKYIKDYEYNIHAFKHLDDKRMLKLEFTEVPRSHYDRLREFIALYNHEQILFIDWSNVGHQAYIRDNNLEGSADVIGEYYSFKIKLEII